MRRDPTTVDKENAKLKAALLESQRSFEAQRAALLAELTAAEERATSESAIISASRTSA